MAFGDIQMKIFFAHREEHLLLQVIQIIKIHHIWRRVVSTGQQCLCFLTIDFSRYCGGVPDNDAKRFVTHGGRTNES